VTSGKHVSPGSAIVRAVLFDAIDYAGLFPPAELDMPGAVAEYASYLDSGDSWALGRFVVPASRLEELGAVATEHAGEQPASLGDRAWRVTAVLGTDRAADVSRLTRFNATHAVQGATWRGIVDAVEVRAGTAEAIAEAMQVIPEHLERFVEIPITSDPTPLVRAIGRVHACAKVRTGGTTADAFPASADVARFLATCVAERVPFKATAGLHHPLRGDYALTYEPGSAAGRMYGFLNVMLATAFLGVGVDQAEARRLLEERDIPAFLFDDAGVAWSGHQLTAEQLVQSRTIAMRSFGSCSFREPIDDLAGLGLL